MKKILYSLLIVALSLTLVLSLASCDALNGLLGNGEAEVPDLSGISFSDETVTYDGGAHSLEISGTLPEGVTVEYENNGKTNAGKYTVVAKFFFEGEAIEGADLSAILRINKASYADAMKGITFASNSFEYDGEAHSLAM